MTAASELAEFLTETSMTNLPPQAIEHAAMLIASTLASAAMGSGLASSAIIRSLARERGGISEASLWFDTGPKLPAADAAQVNAVMSDAAASDDSDLRNIVHAGTTLVATTFAIAERTGARGEDILTAIVLGYEAAGRFGGAVAAGRLLQLDAVHLAQAIALSATSIGGLMAAANTSVAREYHAGLAAMLGIQAALAAQRGYKAEESILETRQGFLEVYGGTDGIGRAGVTHELGLSWDIVTDMAIKLAPGGHPYHALAEAAANAAKKADFMPEAVESITVSRPGFTALTGPLHPTDLIGMAHSPAYFLAAGAADRDFSWIHATAAKISDPVIHQLIDKVRVGAPPTDNAARYRQGAAVTIRTKDGRISTSTIFEPKGAAAGGIAWGDVDTKYRTLVPHAGVPERQIEASLAVIHEFRDVDHVSKLIDLLRV